MTDDGWDALAREFDLWRAQGMTARLWLRDDDAIEPTPALEQLVGLARRWQAPILLAIIPASATPALARRLENEPLITPCQHGFIHANHADAGTKKSEFGPQRPLSAAVADLRQGSRHLAALFGARAAQVFVPPWNRIAPETAAALPVLGFTTLSAFGPPRGASAGLAEINCDLDIIDWHNGRRCVPHAILNGRLAALLALARVSGGGATGILTHHLAQDPTAWDWLEKLMQCALHHSCVRWAAATEVVKTN